MTLNSVDTFLKLVIVVELIALIIRSGPRLEDLRRVFVSHVESMKWIRGLCFFKIWDMGEKCKSKVVLA